MLAASRFWVTFVVLVSSRAAGLPEAPDTGVGFGYCAAPYPPGCINEAQVFVDFGRIKACQEEIRHYTATVISYRACLLRETERAVLQTNKIIDRFKCGTVARRPC